MKNLLKVLLVFCLISFANQTVLIAADDGFSLVAKSKYFSIYAENNLDISLFLSRLNFNYLRQISAVNDDSDNLKDVLTRTMDALYLEVSDVMDIHIYSLHVDIKVCDDKNSVNSVFRNIFGQNFNQASFYLPERNVIYISQEDLTLGMLGHEVAHAIISHYFIVPPPAKVQEVLAGYVEYSLRKSRK